MRRLSNLRAAFMTTSEPVKFVDTDSTVWCMMV